MLLEGEFLQCVEIIAVSELNVEGIDNRSSRLHEDRKVGIAEVESF